ncbi:MAG: hypothetical protein NC299_10140 [Lachnospiraceae bacterium]|nr:hypothetical protein [Ruminococcus sp.]MCM1275706.1 hypothetical protein [Lachnospiraceae bacterium]
MSNCTKKIAASAAAIIGSVLLCGCSKLPFNPLTPSKPSFDGTYTVCADIVCGELSAKADITRNGASDWVFSFTEPKQLNGITMSLGENGWSAKLGELSFAVDDSGVYTLIPEVIGASVDSLSALANESLSSEDGVLTADAEFGGKKVTISANERSGELISLKCPYHKLSVSFTKQQPFTPFDPEQGGLMPEE